MAAESVRYDEAGNVRPKGSCKSMKGSVIDNRKKYPSTLDFANENTNEGIRKGAAARRPGGAYRGAKHGFHTVACKCGTHPCRCGIKEARDGHIIHDHTQHDAPKNHSVHTKRNPVVHKHGVENPTG